MKTTWVTGTLLLGVTAAAPAGGLAQPEQGTRVTVVGGAYTNIDPAALRAMLARKDFWLVNVHVPYEGEIARTDAQVPFDQIAARREALPADRDARIVLYCRSGRMSATAAETLVRLGYRNVWNLEGGFEAWERARLPLLRR